MGPDKQNLQGGYLIYKPVQQPISALYTKVD